jgi:hypothetical protein
MKTPRGVLIFQIATALVFSAHYLLIGAMSAAGLNFLAAIQCVCYFIRDKLQKKGYVVTVIFSVLVVVTSILTWDGWYSVFIMLGLVVLNIGLAFSAQTIRKMNLIKSPLCLTYNIFVLSIGGIVYEAATLISSIIAIVRTSLQEKKAKMLTEEEQSNEEI